MEKDDRWTLVIGGAGYIGGFVVDAIRSKGQSVVVLDNLVKGHRWALPGDITLIEGDIGDGDLLDKVFSEYDIHVVVHLASYIEVRESRKVPLVYFNNNIGQTLSLLDAMVRNDVKKIIFSSSAAVYGETDEFPITEDTRLNPADPYGETKYLNEKVLKDYDKRCGIRSICLRYFNAAGGGKDRGEAHDPETHLIPKVLDIALGYKEFFQLTHEKFDTHDGSPIRDYVHVEDIANAHTLAIDYLEMHDSSSIFNIGTGKGSSVNEVLELVEKTIGHEIPKKYTSAIFGGSSRLVTSYGKANRELGWEAGNDMERIIGTAWQWHQKKPAPSKTRTHLQMTPELLEEFTGRLEGNDVIHPDLLFEILFRLSVDIHATLPEESSFVTSARDIFNRTYDSKEIFKLVKSEMKEPLMAKQEGLLLTALQERLLGLLNDLQ